MSVGYDRTMDALVISADAADYSLLIETSTPSQSCPSLEANTVDSIKLASLSLILSDQRMDDASVIACMEDFQRVNPDSENGPWLEVIPDDLVHKLKDLLPARHSHVAQQLIQTEEAVLDGWELESTTQFVRNLVAFTRENVQGSKKLLLLTSL